MSNCTICLDPLLVDLQCATKCGHVFHSQCIHQWLSQKKQCPNCNVKTTKSKLCKLFISPPARGQYESLEDELNALQSAHEEQGRRLQSALTELKQQQMRTQSYIQKNIEIDEECDELRARITARDQENERLQQQMESLRKANKTRAAARGGDRDDVGSPPMVRASRSRKRKRSAIDLSLSDDDDVALSSNVQRRRSVRLLESAQSEDSAKWVALRMSGEDDAGGQSDSASMGPSSSNETTAFDSSEHSLEDTDSAEDDDLESRGLIRRRKGAAGPAAFEGPRAAPPKRKRRKVGR